MQKEPSTPNSLIIKLKFIKTGVTCVLLPPKQICWFISVRSRKGKGSLKFLKTSAKYSRLKQKRKIDILTEVTVHSELREVLKIIEANE